MRAKPDITVHLIEQFKELIAGGRFKPGKKIPPERDLAEELDVSRGSIRQALKTLEVMGVLTQRVGDGTYLSRDSFSVLSEPMEFLVLLGGISYDELYDTRHLVEPELAARAAERAGPDDLEAIRKTITDMEAQVEDLEAVQKFDVAFHQAIFRAAGNRVAEMIFTVLFRALFNSMKVTSRLVDQKQVVESHKEVYAAIAKHDPNAARRAMKAHLEWGRNLKILAQRRPPIQTPA